MPKGEPKHQEPLPDECLSRIFNHFAHKVVKDFPHLKDRFLFYSAPTDSFHGTLNGRRGANAAMDRLQDEADTFLMDDIPETAFAGFDQGFYTMAFIRQEEARCMTSMNETQTRDILNVLEHELGHLVVPAADYTFQEGHSRNFCENAADTFAMIRHSQENDGFGGALDATLWIRTMDFISSAQKVPLAAPVLNALKDLGQHHDLSTLTPVETANLAYRLALHHSYSDLELTRLRDAFKPVKELFQKSDLAGALKKCGEIMLADHGGLSADVVATGRALLEPFLNRRMSILTTQFDKSDLINLALEGPLWTQVRDKIRGKRASADKVFDRLEALGAFDAKPQELISPKSYESIKNQTTVANARNAYAEQTPRKKTGSKPSR